MLASAIRFGVSSPRRPRQLFLCRFELRGGKRGEHRFTEPMPRLMSKLAVCPDCGQPTDAWKGEQVFPNYQFTAQPIAAALARLAMGASYRKAAVVLRAEAGLTLGGPAMGSSRDAHLVQRITEVAAPLLHQALAPQIWPEGGLIAVDAVRFNLLGRHKYASGLKAVEHAHSSLLDTLDPDDGQDQAARKALEKFLPPNESNLPGAQGGVPTWQIFGAYGYPLNPKGEIPRTQGAGQPWLFRAYRSGDALSWAHFFRQLPGTPAYVLSDLAPAIGVGMELAWPDPGTRPQQLICEYHASEVIKSRLPQDPGLEEAAKRLFLTTGRWVNGSYHPDAANGGVGSILRLRHFAAFRRLAREAEIFDFDRLFATPTWRRVMAQVVNKDWKLRYSTGALEAQLFELGDRQISWRAGRMTNRARADALLMLLHLGMLQQATPSKFLQVIEHCLRHNSRLPRQLRPTDPKGAPPSLRRALTDAELTAVGLMTKRQFGAWKKTRHNLLVALRQSRRAPKRSSRRPVNARALVALIPPAEKENSHVA